MHNLVDLLPGDAGGGEHPLVLGATDGDDVPDQQGLQLLVLDALPDHHELVDAVGRPGMKKTD